MDSYPSNSSAPKPRESRKEHPTVEPIVTSGVSEKPKGIKLKDAFIAADVNSVFGYVITDVVLPAVRNLIVESAQRGVERLIYGEGSSRVRTPSPVSRVSYSSFSSSAPHRAASSYQPRPSTPLRRDDSAFIFDQREDAVNVLNALNDIIDSYQSASVSDLKELMGLPTNPIDNRWGWDSAIPAKIKQSRSGFSLELPATTDLR
jgi:hypothetical protein